MRAREEARVEHRGARDRERAGAMRDHRHRRRARAASRQRRTAKRRAQAIRAPPRARPFRCFFRPGSAKVPALLRSVRRGGRCNRSRRRSSNSGFRPCRFVRVLTWARFAACADSTAARPACDGAARIARHARFAAASMRRTALPLLEKTIFSRPRARFRDPAHRRRGRVLRGARLDRQVPRGALSGAAARLGALRGAGACDRAVARADDALAAPADTRQPRLQIVRGTTVLLFVAVLLQRAQVPAARRRDGDQLHDAHARDPALGRLAEGADDVAALGVRRRRNDRHAARSCGPAPRSCTARRCWRWSAPASTRRSRS